MMDRSSILFKTCFKQAQSLLILSLYTLIVFSNISIEPLICLRGVVAEMKETIDVVESVSRVMTVFDEDFDKMKGKDEETFFFPNYDDDRVELFVVLITSQWPESHRLLSDEYDKASLLLYERWVNQRSKNYPSVTEKTTERSVGLDNDQMFIPYALLLKADVEDAGVSHILYKLNVVGIPSFYFFWKDSKFRGHKHFDVTEISNLISKEGPGILTSDQIVDFVVTTNQKYLDNEL